METAGGLQYLLHLAQEEGPVDGGHLEEEGEDVEERGSGEELGECLYLLTRREDTCSLKGNGQYIRFESSLYMYVGKMGELHCL